MYVGLCVQLPSWRWT